MPISKEVLSKYIGDVFVETGSSTGNGIKTALDCGFKEIYSCEPNLDLCKVCVNRFQGLEEVHLFNMESTQFLKEYFTMNCVSNATYWLDSHINSKRDQVYNKPSPILDELNIIFEMSPDSDYTILIDDVRLFRKSKWGVKLEDILKVANNYGLNASYEDGYTKGDILVLKE